MNWRVAMADLRLVKEIEERCRCKYRDLNPIAIPSHLRPLCIYTLALASSLIHILVHVFGLFGTAMQSKGVAIPTLVLKRVDRCFENYVFRSRHPYVAVMRRFAEGEFWLGVRFPLYNCIWVDISDGTKLPETVAATETSSVWDVCRFARRIGYKANNSLVSAPGEPIHIH
jgi:hypothetical protein